ncbi:YsnF/AvaK domain-containing protein [Sphingomonas aliaeris]|uniref:YsnF/AvaK domain-containing protein n=1 Tax=Sphingomonas aliaeris TaxID=2759526 RepID=A0A974NVT2_9SPHN|nr:DUF2382 domain-containing protein [Sphingomonas aliaeris]QQV77939.1 YsnF/AvaK domain-containing protein [Sphingomonas aliaeris]
MSDNIDQTRTIPVIEEQPVIGRREVETDHVRVRTVVEEKHTDVVARLSREELLVERRKVEREVATPPAPVEEGDTLVVSVVEERLVVEKRLFVIEELVIRRVAHTEDVHIPTTLKTMRAIVEQDSVQP